MQRDKVLIINPGSTSTKVAIFKAEENIFTQTLSHNIEKIRAFDSVVSQFDFRKEVILSWLNEIGVKTSELTAVVARGGMIRSIPSGIYAVTDFMQEDLRVGFQGEHASNLGGLLARSIADPEGIGAYIVDPVSVDEFIDIARISGHPAIKRSALSHALNIKATAHKVAGDLGRLITELNMIVVHLGGGISVVPMEKGRIIDNTRADSEGPFSPDRSGGNPVGDVAAMCFSGKYTEKEMLQKTNSKGGLMSHLGTSDVREVEKRIKEGDKKAKLVLEAMCYQIGKQIGAVATCLKGDVDVIVLTGGVAYSEFVTSYIEEMVSFIAPVKIEAGEDELAALNNAYLRMISGENRLKVYDDEVKKNY